MNKKLIVISIVIFFAIFAAGAVYYFVLRPLNSNASDANKPAESYEYAISDSFITNVKDSNKLFKTTIVLVANDKNLQDLLDTDQYIVRDTILFILRNLTQEDIENENIQDTLRQSIPEALNKALGINSIVSIYFSDFVMQ